MYLMFQFRLMLSHDGSGKGAALVAAVAHRVNEAKKQRQLADRVGNMNVNS